MKGRDFKTVVLEKTSITRPADLIFQYLRLEKKL